MLFFVCVFGMPKKKVFSSLSYKHFWKKKSSQMFSKRNLIAFFFLKKKKRHAKYSVIYLYLVIVVK